MQFAVAFWPPSSLHCLCVLFAFNQFSINSALALKAINYFSAINKATKIYTQLQHIYLQHTHTSTHTQSDSDIDDSLHTFGRQLGISLKTIKISVMFYPPLFFMPPLAKCTYMIIESQHLNPNCTISKLSTDTHTHTQKKSKINCKYS